MARHSLQQFVASVSNSLEVLILAFAPVALGLLAFIAMPVMMATSHGALAACAAVAAQAVLFALPVALLRKRLHPADAVAWERMLPVPPSLAWRADWLVAGRLEVWMAGLCAVSAAIWIYQWPTWLRPVWGRALLALAASVALGWALAAAVLAARRLGLHLSAPRQHMPAAHGARAAGQSAPYRPRPLRPRMAALWHRLFWLPFWRGESRVGMQQGLLLLAALTSAALWTLHPLPLLPRAVLGLFASATLILLVDRGDKAVREQAAMLAPSLSMWPMAPRGLLVMARAFPLLPGALVLAAVAGLLAAAHGLRPGVAALWLAAAGVALCAIVTLPAAPRGRVVLVVLSILLLTAIGSELWS